MKTVIDAVNHTRGCWSDNKAMLNISFGKVWFFNDYEVYSPGTTFTRDEFQQCVDEMSRAEWIKP